MITKEQKKRWDNEVSLQDKMLIGILRQKIREGMDTASILMLVMGLCEVLEKVEKKWSIMNVRNVVLDFGVS